MRDEKTFINFLMEWYGKGGFGGDSLDREKVLQLIDMARGDTLAKKHKIEEVA